MKILSIDPGYDRVGVAVIEKTPKGKEFLVYSGCITTSAKFPLRERIFAVGSEISLLIKKYKPESMALEKLYFTTNQKTAMGVSEARGVIIYEASRAGIPIFEYTPMQIKVAVAGHGHAGKEDVRKMVHKLIDVPQGMRLDDEIDAIAVGLTCFAHEKFR